MVNNLTLWESVQQTDPDYTKHFNRGGGFSGTSVNGTWLQKQATRVFGPKGIGWGVNVVNEKYQNGGLITDTSWSVIHVLQIELWYVLDGQRGTITQFGQTTFVGKNKYGIYTDEEAPKKSLTDATTKALSELGFSADIFLGMYDDNKYVNDLKQKKAKEGKPRATAALKKQGQKYLDEIRTVLESMDSLAMLELWDEMKRDLQEHVWGMMTSEQKENARALLDEGRKLQQKTLESQE